MSKDRPTTGTDGLALPVLPPERDARVWARLVRVLFYTPGFLAILLLKTGEPASFGITIELLMLTSAAAIVGGLYIATQSADAGADHSSRIGTWSGSLIIELLAVVPFLCAIPSLFHELAHSTLLHTKAPGAVDVTLGASELLPAVAILPFMLYQLAGFGTLHYVVPKAVNWILNIGIAWPDHRQLCRQPPGRLRFGKDASSGILIVAMALTVFYGVLSCASCRRPTTSTARRRLRSRQQGTESSSVVSVAAVAAAGRRSGSAAR